MPAHYIAVDAALRCIVLAIRSTKSFSDVMTDYNWTPARSDDGWAHDGIARSARWFAAHVLPRLALLRDAYPGFRLRVVGHRSSRADRSARCRLTFVRCVRRAVLAAAWPCSSGWRRASIPSLPTSSVRRRCFRRTLD